MKKLVSLLMAATMCASLAACGGSGTAASGSAAESTAASSSTTEAAATSSDPVSGGELNIPITDDPTTLQGWMVRNTNETTVAPAIYETLWRMIPPARRSPICWIPLRVIPKH